MSRSVRWWNIHTIQPPNVRAHLILQKNMQITYRHNWYTPIDDLRTGNWVSRNTYTLRLTPTRPLTLAWRSTIGCRWQAIGDPRIHNLHFTSDHTSDELEMRSELVWIKELGLPHGSVLLTSGDRWEKFSPQNTNLDLASFSLSTWNSWWILKIILFWPMRANFALKNSIQIRFI